MDTLIAAMGAYYGLDWASMVLGFLGMYFLAERKRIGFAFAIAGAILAMGVSLIAAQYGFIVANAVNIGLGLWGIAKWRTAPAPVAVSEKIR